MGSELIFHFPQGAVKARGKKAAAAEVESYPEAFVQHIDVARTWKAMQEKAAEPSKEIVPVRVFENSCFGPVQYLCVEGDAVKLHELLGKREYTLAVADIPSTTTKNVKGEEVLPWGYDQINMMVSSFRAVTSSLLWRFVIFHSLEQREDVVKVLKEQCSGGVEDCVWYLPTVRPSRDFKTLNKNFEVFTIGFHFNGGSRLSNHFVGFENSRWNQGNVICAEPVVSKIKHSGDNKIVNLQQKPRCVMNWILEHFSFEKDWVLDLCTGSGTMLCSALALARNCVAVDNDVRQMSVLGGRILSLNEDLDGSKEDGYEPLPDLSVQNFNVVQEDLAGAGSGGEAEPEDDLHSAEGSPVPEPPSHSPLRSLGGPPPPASPNRETQISALGGESSTPAGPSKVPDSQDLSLALTVHGFPGPDPAGKSGDGKGPAGAPY